MRNDYVQLCHINAFYYSNMYIYCQMPKRKKKKKNERAAQTPLCAVGYFTEMKSVRKEQG